MHTGGRVVDVAAAVDVAGAEADRGQTRAHLLEEIVVVGHVELAGVFGGVGVRVADQGAFPL